MREFSLPKTTIWHHVHKIKLSSEQVLRLRSAGGRTSSARKQLALEKAGKEALKIINSDQKYHVSLLSMLYWAEGDNKNNFSFVNTNDDMIRLVIRVLDKCLGIKRSQLLITIRYFTGMNRGNCLEHWSKVTGVPKNQIRMYYNDGGSRGRKEFGMCRIGVKKSSYLFKLIRALISSLVDEIILPS
ncbi:MAG: hypothetical protein Q8R55_07745 [Candidatus Taylorbacteria bacterium]|nr:hypothetical protein [Candidatus Taylorbacteria bacterium]